MMNGMSDHYWGQDLGDDEFQTTMNKFGVAIHRPHDVPIGKAFREVHKPHRNRNESKSNFQPEQIKQRAHNEGLNSTRYKILEINEMMIDNAKVTIVNVELECDRKVAPWCESNNLVTF